MHTADELSSGMWDRSGGSIGGDNNSPVGLQALFCCHDFSKHLEGSDHPRLSLFTLKTEKSLSFQVRRVLMGFSGVIYEYRSQPTHSS